MTTSLDSSADRDSGANGRGPGEQQLAGQIVVVLGGTSGIGLECVALWDRQLIEHRPGAGLAAKHDDLALAVERVSQRRVECRPSSLIACSRLKRLSRSGP